jgi:hypothetical protein
MPYSQVLLFFKSFGWVGGGVSEWVGEEEVQRRSDLYSFSRPAGIFKQSAGATNRVGMVVVPARQATRPGGIGSLESIHRLL